MQSTRNQIKEERKKCKITQYELAKALGIDRGALIAVERGKIPTGQEFTQMALDAIRTIALSRISQTAVGVGSN